MTTCVPIKDMRDTAKFTKLVSTSPDPIIVTKNGYDAFVVMRSKDYDALVDAAAQEKLRARMKIAETERELGLGTDAFADIAQARKRYGL